MIITRARREDLPAIVDLEASGFDEARWSEQSWLAELDAADRCVLGVRGETGRLIAVATFSCVADIADLQRVVVAVEHRSRGIGTSLIRAGLEWAQALGAERMLLEVRQDNRAAIAVYSSLGFEPIDQRCDYYGPGLHAIVMSRELEPVGVLAEERWGA